MFQLHEVEHSLAVLYHHGVFIYAFVHSVAAYNLCAIEASVCRSKHEFDAHGRSTGIVARV